MDFYEYIGAKIKEAREAQGLSQPDLGEKIGYSGTAISYYENAKRKISVLDLVKIANALNRPYQYFLQEAQEVLAASDTNNYKDMPDGVKEDIMKIINYVWQKNEEK
jgi:transcriptional regulator with XRE-family HTH domain